MHLEEKEALSDARFLHGQDCLESTRLLLEVMLGGISQMLCNFSNGLPCDIAVCVRRWIM